MYCMGTHRIRTAAADDGATSRNADAEFFTPVPKRIHKQTLHAYARAEKNKYNIILPRTAVHTR